MNVSGTKFGTDFLVDLAGRVETIEDWLTQEQLTTSFNGIPPEKGDHAYIYEHTCDPLAAVMGAMANNPDAALRYFAPSDGDGPFADGDIYLPSPTAQTRMDMLANRKWDDWSVKGLSAAFAGASTLRMPPAPGSDTDDRATWATAHGISILANQDIPSGVAARNTGVMLGNCGPELFAMRNNESADLSINNGVIPPITLGGDETKLENGISTLLYKVAGDSGAANAIAQGAMVYADQSASAAIQANKNDSNFNPITPIQMEYQKAGEVIGMLDQLSADKGKSRDNNASTVAYGVNTAASLISIAEPKVGVPMKLLSVGATTLDKAITDNATTMGSDSLRSATYATAIKQGAMRVGDDADNGDMYARNNTDKWYSSDPESGEPRITLDTSEEREQFNSWADQQGNSGYNQDAASQLDNAGSSGYQEWDQKKRTADSWLKAHGGRK